MAVAEFPNRRFKTLSDGRVLFNPYYGGKTVVLTETEHAELKRLRAADLWAGISIGFAAFAPIVLGLYRVVPASVAVFMLGIVILLGMITHRYFRSRNEAITGRAPISAEQIPRLQLKELAVIWLRAAPDKGLRRGLIIAGFGSLVSSYELVGAVLHLPSTMKAGSHPIWQTFLMFLVCCSLLYIFWQERKRRRNDDTT